MTRIYSMKKNQFSIKKSGTIWKVSYLFPSHRAQVHPQMPSALKRLERQQTGTAISGTEKWTLGN